ncbi:MAG: two-component regulator propeller domain-containing protein, partial [Gammaproteobacteria bacterium]
MAHTSFRHQTDIALGVGTGLAQDRQGFIWMSTQTGLVRWDGFRLRRYIADSSRPGSLPDSYLQCVRVDGSGRIWAGTSSGGLVRYDPAHDNFITIGAGPQGLSHGRVSSLEDDGAGGIWIGTGGGLERIDAAGRLYRAGSGPAQVGASQLPPGGVEVLLREPGGALWIGTRQGLFRRTADHAPLRAITLTGGATEPGINALYQDARGRIWIGTRAHGAFVSPTAGAPARPVSANGLPILQGERVLSVIETRPDVIWFGTEGGGILELDLARQRTRRLRHHP